MAEGENQGAPSRRIFYGWWLALIAGLVIAVATVPLIHAESELIWAFERDLSWNWSWSLHFLVPLMTRIEGALIGPLAGYLVDRFGPRRVILPGLGILAAGFVFFALIQNYWGIFAAYFIMAAGHSLSGDIPMIVMLSRWFVRRRATAIAISLLAAPVVALPLVPLIAWSVVNGVGLRPTAFVMAGFIPVAAVLVFSRVRNRPQDMGMLPDGGPLPGESLEADFSVGQALRSRAFWFILIGDVLASAASHSFALHLGLMMLDGAINTAHIFTTSIITGGVGLCFTLVGGLVGDRNSKPFALALFASLPAAGLVVLALAGSMLPAYFLAAALLGIGWGRAPLVLAILPSYFGTASLGKILGCYFLFASLGSIFFTFQSISVGWLYEITGNFALGLLLVVGTTLLGAFLFLKARSPQLPQADELQAEPG